MSRTLVSLQNFRINELVDESGYYLAGLDLILQRRTERGRLQSEDDPIRMTLVLTPEQARDLGTKLAQSSHKAQTSWAIRFTDRHVETPRLRSSNRTESAHVAYTPAAATVGIASILHATRPAPDTSCARSRRSAAACP